MITEKTLEKFIHKAQRELNGEWVLLGGSLLSLLKIQTRVTYDIDIVELDKRSQDIALMQIADDLGMPIEAINQAAAFFLEKQKNYKENLILLNEDKNFKLFRPNLSLYLALKMNRGTESDINDSIAYIKYCLKNDDIKISESRKLREKYPELFKDL